MRRCSSLVFSCAFAWVPLECEAVAIQVPSGDIPDDDKREARLFGAILPPARPAVPPSLQGRKLRIDLRDASQHGLAASTAKGIDCGQNALCASFDAPQQGRVSAWFGFPYEHDDIDFFIATHGQEAFDLGGGAYATRPWDRRHFFIETRSEGVPLGLQPRYVGTDEETGNILYAAEYVGYRRPLTDYSAFEFGMSISTLVIEFDAKTETFVDMHIAYYDENGDYTDEDYPLAPGDEFVSFFVGFQEADPDFVYLFSVEDMATVDIAPVLSYREQYPGRDFPCTHCPAELDLLNIQVHYLFESLVNGRFAYSEVRPFVGERIFTDGFDALSPR